MSSLQFNTSDINHLNKNKHKNETIKNYKNKWGRKDCGEKVCLKKDLEEGIDLIFSDCSFYDLGG